MSYPYRPSYYVPPVAVPKVMLVWVTEGRNRFVKEVPYDPSDTRERVKV